MDLPQPRKLSTGSQSILCADILVPPERNYAVGPRSAEGLDPGTTRRRTRILPPPRTITAQCPITPVGRVGEEGGGQGTTVHKATTSEDVGVFVATAERERGVSHRYVSRQYKHPVRCGYMRSGGE